MGHGMVFAIFIFIFIATKIGGAFDVARVRVKYSSFSFLRGKVAVVVVDDVPTL